MENDDGLAMAGAVLAGPGPRLVIAAASGPVELTRFWKFDRKPVIADGDLDAAAMVHDAREVLSSWRTVRSAPRNRFRLTDI